MDQAFLLPVIVWVILTVFFLLDRSFSIVLKGLILIILVFHLYFWWDELYSTFSLLMKARGNNIKKLAKDSFQLAILSLFWIWPTLLASSMLFVDLRYKNNTILIAILFSIASIAGYVLLNWF